MVCIALLTLFSAGSAGNIRPASAAGLASISVVGNHFVDGSGATIRLLGVNRSGTEYACIQGWGIFDGPSDDASVAAMASWHANTVRVPLNEDCWLGINMGSSTEGGAVYRTAIVNYVNLLHAHGLYAILDLHWNAAGTNQATGLQLMADADHGPAFWTSVATTFKTDSKVLFDLYNEPHGISWACWRDGCMAASGNGSGPLYQTAGMQSLVDAVRATGANQPILVGGNSSASDFAQWLSFRPTDSVSQLSASFHNYDFTGCDVTCSTSAVLPVAASVPVVIGELGESDCAHGYIDGYMTWADAHGISYLGWAWNPFNCSNFPSLITAYDGTPTNFGIGFRDHLAGLAGNTATVTLVAPNSGPVAGGTSVTITGTNFTGATAVKFGAATATFAVNNAAHITATSPPGSGIVDVTVTTSGGSSATRMADQFTYTGPPPPAPTVTVVAPNSGPAAGGTSVIITGTNLTAATAVKFGTLGATTYAVNSATQITATSPLGSGVVDVTVTTAGGVSATSAADKFTYIARPAVSSLAPVGGPAGGGTSVIITGTNFAGATAVKVGSAAATTYAVDSATQITAMSPPGSGAVDVRVTTAGGTSATSNADLFTYLQAPGPYHPLSPSRILDTRTSVGGHPEPLGPRGTMTIQITGQGGVPSTGVSAVVMNVTVTSTTAGSYLTIYPAGVQRPLASNLNWVAGQTVANLVEVAVGAGGKVAAFNGAGSTDVIFDVAGYVSIPTGTPGTDGLYNPVLPNRILDTRSGNGGHHGAVGPGQTINVQIGGRSGSGVPATGVSAVVLNVTATGATASSFLIVYPMGTSRPLASNLNFTAGQTVPNRVIVKVGTNAQTTTSGWVSIYNGAGAVNVVADVGGWFTDGSDLGATGADFGAMTPTRLMDTRNGHGPIGAGGTMVLPIAGHNGVPANATAVVLNVTVTGPTAASVMTVWPAGTTRPLASDLNYRARQTVPNLVVVKLGSGAVDFYNTVGSTDVVVDIVGWYG